MSGPSELCPPLLSALMLVLCVHAAGSRWRVKLPFVGGNYSWAESLAGCLYAVLQQLCMVTMAMRPLIILWFHLCRAGLFRIDMEMLNEIKKPNCDDACVCWCVCAYEMDGESMGTHEAISWKCVSVCVCVCLCVSVCVCINWASIESCLANYFTATYEWWYSNRLFVVQGWPKRSH